jgi:2-methylisocitrate lyase-like PEP mutase family enzyme
MADLKDMLDAGETVLAPLALNALMAKLAEQAGFRALYLGGGASGYQAVWLEANLTLTEMAAAGTAVRSACDLPLILDGAGGWGDPMHIHRSVRHAEAAGFAAIEIEDQLLPKRAHHHVGLEHMIPAELMAAKVREAVAARRSDRFLIIARTNAVRASSMDDALRRAEAYRAAGADVLLLSPRTAEECRHIAERIDGPRMLLLTGGPRALGLTVEELGGMGYRLLVDAQGPLLAAYRAWRDAYAAMRDNGFNIPGLDHAGAAAVQEEIHRTIGLDDLLAVERATVEKPAR